MVSQTLNTVKSTVKFAKISRPDPRDPNFNREESSHCSPYHPHDAHANGTPTTFCEVLGPALKKVRHESRPKTGVQGSGGRWGRAGGMLSASWGYE